MRGEYGRIAVNRSRSEGVQGGETAFRAIGRACETSHSPGLLKADTVRLRRLEREDVPTARTNPPRVDPLRTRVIAVGDTKTACSEGHGPRRRAMKATSHMLSLAVLTLGVAVSVVA